MSAHLRLVEHTWLALQSLSVAQVTVVSVMICRHVPVPAGTSPAHSMGSLSHGEYIPDDG
jgi:hypothetical protein